VAGVVRSQPIDVLSIIMPVYNEVGTVGEAIERVLEVELPGVRKQIIIVESNSTDGTRAVVEAVADEVDVMVIRQDRPRGKGHAVRAGLDEAKGEVVLIQDGDLEYSVEDYPALLEPIVAGEAAFVLGTRHVRGRPMREFAEARATSVVMNTAHWVFATLINLVYGTTMRDPFTMYKVFRTECIDGLRFSANRFDFDWELVSKLVRAGYDPVEVPVTYHSRDFHSGKKVRLFRDPGTWLVALVRYRFERLYP
jgi:glycosyltransferase involved in cell wall biosynthesis